VRRKGNKLGEPCLNVRLSPDRLSIEPSLSGLLRANVTQPKALAYLPGSPWQRKGRFYKTETTPRWMMNWLNVAVRLYAFRPWTWKIEDLGHSFQNGNGSMLYNRRPMDWEAFDLQNDALPKLIFVGWSLILPIRLYDTFTETSVVTFHITD